MATDLSIPATGLPPAPGLAHEEPEMADEDDIPVTRDPQAEEEMKQLPAPATQPGSAGEGRESSRRP